MKYFLYTKGSCDNYSAYREGAFAYLITDSKKNVLKTFSRNTLGTTNNAMSIKAIVEGCKAIMEENAEVVVYSDNQYSLNVLSGLWNAKANKELIDQHKKSQKRLHIKYVWVKKNWDNNFYKIVLSGLKASIDEIMQTHNIDKCYSHKMYKKCYHKKTKY